MRRVLIVANDFTAIHHFRMELLERLHNDGYPVILVMPEDEKNAAFLPIVSKLVTIPLSRFGTNPLMEFKTYKAIRRVIRKEKPDVVLTYTAKPNIYGGLAVAAEKIPYISTVTGLGSNFDKQNIISKIMIKLEKKAFKNAKTVFFQNELNMSILHKHGIAINNSKLVSGSGVNLIANSYESYPENKKIIFLAAARIRKDKGYDELFSVIKRFYNEQIPAEFHIIGWYEEDAYKEIVEDMQNNFGVHFYNYIPHDQMHKYISLCDCLVQPSHHEGMSNIILEAAATGRPCIVSNIHGCKEAVKDEETGYLFEVKSSDDLYKKMKKFMVLDKQSREEMGRRARAFMEQSFDRNQVVQTYINEINQ